ncbi:hypothetical protein CBR_g39483 [Chara braunii]|uniref:Reverse transcriptase domain-containing protein n=1 Tax=Chara braunii TaxID=69332 RepID=A0A388LRZ1_CHABU|nr:hypothetical protein CBR_g39483 [Chara braunii]|eukprot:GBG85019.1 hypothetical protein CBR_g39483 [Chara braunii]
MKECRELAGRAARVEQIFLRIWGLDDSHLDGKVPETPDHNPPVNHDTPATRCNDLAIEEEERIEMELAIAAITASIRDSPLTTERVGGSASERDQYTAFVPLASAFWVEHMSTGHKHAIWKIDTFNHLAPISIRAFQFLGNITDEQVRQCRAQILKGKLKYSGRVTPLDPQDLKFPPMRELDPDKCGASSSGMWQKGIRQEGKPELRALRKVWSVGRPYLKCKCKREKNKDCGDTPLWFDHAIWYLLAHPDILFPTMTSIKVRTSMLIHYLRTTWRDGVLAAIGFHFLRDLMIGFVKELQADATLNAESIMKEDRLWNYPIPAALARIMFPTRIPEKPSRFPLASPRAAARKRGVGAQVPGQTTLNFQRVRPVEGAPSSPPPPPPPPPSPMPPPPPPPPLPQQPPVMMVAGNGPVANGPHLADAAHDPPPTEGQRAVPLRAAWAPVLASPIPSVQHPLMIIRGLTPPPVIHISPGSSAQSTLTQIGWTYNCSTASKLCRPAEFFCEFDVARWMDSYDPEHCPCRAQRYADMRSTWSIELLQNEGCTHVITLDSSITDNPSLQGIINAGLNHIPCMALDVDEATTELGNFLDDLFAWVLELRELTDSTKSFLRKIILKKAGGKMEKYRMAHTHAALEPFEHPAVKKELEFLTHRFLICPTDKAPNTLAFVCKNFIRKLAFQRLSGPEFACVNASPAAILTSIHGELSAFLALLVVPATLPYLMTVLKAHKGTFWWITNTANTIISPAAEVCACLLRFLLPLVQTFCLERSMEVQQQHGVKPNLWWSINSVGEFCANLPEKVYSVFTADITRCFETIPTDGSKDSLSAAVRFYVQCAMRIRRERNSSHAIRIRFGGNDNPWPSWADADQPEEMGALLFKEEDICWITGWCIANSLLRMGDYVWRQVRGIPMGLACSPIWCDIYFFKYEYHAMIRLVDTGNVHLIPCFDNTCRYIDDLGAVNNTVIGGFLRKKGDRLADDPCWIYPEKYTEIKENTKVSKDGVGLVANFLSMTVTVTCPIADAYSTTKHDKRGGLGFSPCRFIKYRSNKSVKQSLQIITAQVAQIFLLCSEPEGATNEIAKVVTAMTGNGFSAESCWKVVKRTLRMAHIYQLGRLSVHVIREALSSLYGIAG